MCIKAQAPEKSFPGKRDLCFVYTTSVHTLSHPFKGPRSRSQESAYINVFLTLCPPTFRNEPRNGETTMVVQRSAAVRVTAPFISTVLTQPYSGQDIVIDLWVESTFEASVGETAV